MRVSHLTRNKRVLEPLKTFNVTLKISLSGPKQRMLLPLPEIPGASCPHWSVAAAAAKSLQSCPILCNPIDSSPLGSFVPGILQARILEWIAISFSNTWKWKVKVKSFSRVQLLVTPWTGAYQAPLSMGFSRQEYWSGVPLVSGGEHKWQGQRQPGNLEQGSPNSWSGTGAICQISCSIRLEIKCTINVMCLNDPQTILPPTLSVWKSCLLWNWPLGPKMLRTSNLDDNPRLPSVCSIARLVLEESCCDKRGKEERPQHILFLAWRTVA